MNTMCPPWSIITEGAIWEPAYVMILREIMNISDMYSLFITQCPLNSVMTHYRSKWALNFHSFKTWFYTSVCHSSNVQWFGMFSTYMSMWVCIKSRIHMGNHVIVKITIIIEKRWRSYYILICKLFIKMSVPLHWMKLV